MNLGVPVFDVILFLFLIKCEKIEIPIYYFGVNKCAAKNHPNPSSIYLEIIPSFECFNTFSCIKFKNGFLNASIDIDG